jgi:hypothetical protein
MTRKGEVSWNRKDVDIQLITRLYVDERMSGERIAETLGVSPFVVYSRIRALGLVRSNSEAHVGLQAAERNPNWQGGRHIGPSGYVRVRIGGKQRNEHRVVMEQILGRPLQRTEVVHHINHDKSDNRPENLTLLSGQAEHMRHHMTPDEARRRGKNGGWAKRAALHACGVQVDEVTG